VSRTGLKYYLHFQRMRGERKKMRKGRENLTENSELGWHHIGQELWGLSPEDDNYLNESWIF
jgi:hypothetical protein